MRSGLSLGLAAIASSLTVAAPVSDSGTITTASVAQSIKTEEFSPGIFSMPREGPLVTESKVIPTMRISIASGEETGEITGPEEADSIPGLFWEATATSTTATAPKTQLSETEDERSDTVGSIPAFFHGGGHDRSLAPGVATNPIEKRGEDWANWRGRWDENWSDGIERYQSDRSKLIDFEGLLPECIRYCFSKHNPSWVGDIFKVSVGDFCSGEREDLWDGWFWWGPHQCLSQKGRCSDYEAAMSRDWYVKNCGWE